VAMVAQARPHLVDAWDAVAYLESIGYTDARVKREVGLPDLRALGESICARLSDRPLPVVPGTNAIEPTDAHAGGARALAATVATAAAWAAMVVLQRRAIAMSGLGLQLALMLSVIVSVGFLEVTRRLGRFYSSVGQPWLGRVALWYFVRLGALTTVAVAAAGVGVGWMSGAAWPSLVLWADEFIIVNALWLLLAAVQMPGVVSRRRAGQPVPLPRMTVIAFRESRVVAMGALYALVFGLGVHTALAFTGVSRSGYAALGTVGAAALTFVLSTLAVRRWSRPRSVSFS